MTRAIKAIYEDGVLKPRAPLQLEEHSEVEGLSLDTGFLFAPFDADVALPGPLPR